MYAGAHYEALSQGSFEWLSDATSVLVRGVLSLTLSGSLIHASHRQYVVLVLAPESGCPLVLDARVLSGDLDQDCGTVDENLQESIDLPLSHVNV